MDTDVPAFSKQRQRPGAMEQHRQDPFQNCSQETSRMNQGKMKLPYLGPAGTSLLDSAHQVQTQTGTTGTLHWKGCL